MFNPSFNGMTDLEVESFLTEQGYDRFRKLADGDWIILMPLAYTLSVCCGPDLTSPFKYR